jgi:hypothetical protein
MTRSFRGSYQCSSLDRLPTIDPVIHMAYTAIYPTDDFYLSEFETATARKPPKESKVIAKHATYPDLHGDYCSFSRIEIHEDSYRKLLEDLRRDSRFTALPDGDIPDGNIPVVKLQPLRVVSSFARNDAAPDHQQTISFLENGTQIEAHVCVT